MSHEEPQESDGGRSTIARNVAIGLGASAIIGGVVALDRRHHQKIAEALLPPEDYTGPTKHGRALMIVAKVHVEGSMPRPQLLEWLQETLGCKPKTASALLRRLVLAQDNALLTEREVAAPGVESHTEVVLTEAMEWAVSSPDAPKNELLSSYVRLYEAEKQADTYASGS